MKEQQYPWEADLRQQVEQHEFDYDPGAWSEMEELLDGGSVTSASTEPATTLASSWLKWAFFALLGTALVILLLRRSTQKEQSHNLRELPELEQEDLLKEQIQDWSKPAITSLEEIEAVNSQSLAPPSRIVEIVAPLPPLAFKEVRRLPLRTGAYQTSPLPTIEWTLLPDSLSARDALPEPKLPRRKRNRKKLFPDVLNQN